MIRLTCLVGMRDIVIEDIFKSSESIKNFLMMVQIKSQNIFLG